MQTIQFQYTSREYARGLRRYRMRHFRVGRDLSIAVVLAVAAYGVFDRSWPFWLIAGAATLYMLIAGLSVGLYPELAPRLRPHLNEPYTLVFSEREIAFSTPSSESTLPWSIYRAWTRDSEYVFLSLGRGHATILPRRSLGDPRTETALFELFTQRIGPEQSVA